MTYPCYIIVLCLFEQEIDLSGVIALNCTALFHMSQCENLSKQLAPLHSFWCYFLSCIHGNVQPSFIYHFENIIQFACIDPEVFLGGQLYPVAEK